MSEPIISETTLTSLETLCRNAQAIAYQAQEAADQLQSAAKLLNDSLKRAREMNRPVHVPAETVRGGGEKATWKSEGPQMVLMFLDHHYAETLSVHTIATATCYSESTVRTYLPVLMREGFVQKDDWGHRITEAGRAALLS